MTSTITPPVVTGVDLPSGSPGGSVELLHDLYVGSSAPLAAQAFMLARAGSTATPSGEPALLTVPGKYADGPQFWRYVAGLTCALSAAITRPAALSRTCSTSRSAPHPRSSAHSRSCGG
jgi:hypothetical protein